MNDPGADGLGDLERAACRSARPRPMVGNWRLSALCCRAAARASRGVDIGQERVEGKEDDADQVES